MHREEWVEYFQLLEMRRPVSFQPDGGGGGGGGEKGKLLERTAGVAESSGQI